MAERRGRLGKHSARGAWRVPRAARSTRTLGIHTASKSGLHMYLKVTISLVILASVLGCASTTARGKEQLKVGMTSAEVGELLGSPDGRSFRESYEAWQYHDIVGMGQCEYLTVWFTDSVLHAITTWRGASVAGCGIGSRQIDWAQMPKPPTKVNAPN